MVDVYNKTGRLTKKSDTTGIELLICDPMWFDKRSVFKIANSPPRTASLEFSGDDLNFVARVLYAESSGSAQIKDSNERALEKRAILSVKYFRLNRHGYPNRIKAKTFREVCEAPGQFESVYANSPKFSGSSFQYYESLNRFECNDLTEAIQAVRDFVDIGADADLVFDNFRGGKGARGRVIGGSRFWLSVEGGRFHEKEK